MSAANVARALGDARREGRGWRCRCPLHGGRSLVLHDGSRGRLLATCWAGCDRLDVLAELRRLELIDGRATDYRAARAAPPARNDAAERTARALMIWREARPIAETIVAHYLAGRGIELDAWPDSLRYHARCLHPGGARLPAMVALVEHVDRGLVAIHRTFLMPDGLGKAHVVPDKASLGPIGGGAVRLGKVQPNTWLCVAEGIETALSVVVACAMPVWAALSAGGIRALVLPPKATHVVISADHDASGVGQSAAQDAAQRWLAEGRRVRVATPPNLGTDFNDLLRGELVPIAEARDVT